MRRRLSATNQQGAVYVDHVGHPPTLIRLLWRDR